MRRVARQNQQKGGELSSLSSKRSGDNSFVTMERDLLFEYCISIIEADPSAMVALPPTKKKKSSATGMCLLSFVVSLLAFFRWLDLIPVVVFTVLQPLTGKVLAMLVAAATAVL